MLSVLLGAGLAGLAALPHGAHAQEPITDDTHFYGQSPPVYPSPNITGTGDWADAFAKAQAFVGQLSIEEKINLTAGQTVSDGCAGNIPGIPRLNFPGLCLMDAGNGLRATDLVSSWPSGIHVGASWNKDLTLQRAYGMGNEFRKKGVNVLLGPVVGPLGRVLLGGRNWEGISPDPYLSGTLVHETVKGVQGAGVITSTKHYIGNEQESYRNPNSKTGTASVSANIDDATMHELYLWPFQDAVKAGSANMMCSYQRINNSYGCANSYTLNGLLKTELGFQGWVVTDWYAQHAGVATALAGLDMAMPDAENFWGNALLESIRNGSVPESRVDDMAHRIIASWYHLGQDQGFPAPGSGMPADLGAPYVPVDGRNASDKPTLLKGAEEGHVLVKNIKGALPLQKPRLISIFGYSAKNPDHNGPGGQWSFGAESSQEDLFANFQDSDPFKKHDGIAPNGTIYSGGGSGGTAQSRVIAPLDALIQQAYEEDTALFWDIHGFDPIVTSSSDVCLVFGNAFASESFDRPGLTDDFTDGLINNVADKCANTIVIIHNAGVRLVDQWIDHPNITAVMFAHLPGQDSGKATVNLLYGRSNPSGKLPYTVARNESDYGALLKPSTAEGIYAKFPQSDFKEGVFIDYRDFDARDVEPRFEFGFGLSYTTFGYGSLTVNTSESVSFAEYPTGPIAMGGQTDLWDVLATVTAKVTNTGDVDGAEVAQLYVGSPVTGQPARVLRGFAKPTIKVGETATVSFELTRRDLSVWDAAAQKWKLPSGKFGVFVGGSSRNLPLQGSLDICSGPVCDKA